MREPTKPWLRQLKIGILRRLSMRGHFHALGEQIRRLREGAKTWHVDAGCLNLWMKTGVRIPTSTAQRIRSTRCETWLSMMPKSLPILRPTMSKPEVIVCGHPSSWRLSRPQNKMESNGFTKEETGKKRHFRKYHKSQKLACVYRQEQPLTPIYQRHKD